MKVTAKIQIGLAIFALLFFIALTWGVVQDANWIAAIDNAGFHLIREPLSPNRTWFFKNVTRSGNEKWSLTLMFILALVFIFQRKAKATIFLLINVSVLGLGLSTLLKMVVDRPRPHIVHLIQAHGLSFPSGHTMNAVLLYGSLIILSNYYLSNDGLRFALNAVLGVVIIALPLSRIYLGVHYPTDVLAGYALGFTMLMLSKFVIFRFQEHEIKPSSRSSRN